MNSRLKMRGYGGAAIVVLTATVGWLMVQLPSLQDSAARSDATAGQALSQVVDVKAQVTANAKALNEANRRLIALGKAPVPMPKVEPTTPPAEPDEFTAAEAAAVRLIVADQLTRQNVTLTQAEISQVARVAAALIPKPADGKSPTPAQILPVVTSVVAAYCTGDKCVGRSGADGKPGRDGADGKDAPKVTDEELLAAAQQALAAYCAQDSKPCTPRDGRDGTPGVGITDMDCVGSGDDSYWRIYLSNDTTKTALGPCRIAPILPPATPGE